MQYGKGLFHLYPLVPLAISLICGIAVGGLTLDIEGLLWRVVLIIAPLLLFLLLLRYKTFCSVMLLVAIFFCGHFMIYISNVHANVYPPTKKIAYEAVILSEPLVYKKSYRFDMMLVSGSLVGRIVRATLIKDTVAPQSPPLIGTTITVHSQIYRPVYYEQSRHFDYSFYLKSHGIIGETLLFPGNWHYSSVSHNVFGVIPNLRLSALCLRHSILSRCDGFGLSDESLALISALALGYRNNISKEVRARWSDAGISHLLALSGMHLCIVYVLLATLFPFPRRVPIIRESLLIVIIWCYVFLVGMPISVVRAAVMLSIFSSLKLCGRDNIGINTLSFAAIVILLFDPFCLYDIGFQLSFLSVTGIMTIGKILGNILSYNLLNRYILLRWLKETVIMTCSAQLSTAPLVAYYFGRLPLYFLLTNLIAIPVVTILLYLTALMFALSFVPYAQHIIVVVISKITLWLNSFLSSVSFLPFSSLSNLEPSKLEVCLCYILILVVWLFFHKKQKGYSSYSTFLY